MLKRSSFVAALALTGFSFPALAAGGPADPVTGVYNYARQHHLDAPWSDNRALADVLHNRTG